MAPSDSKTLFWTRIEDSNDDRRERRLVRRWNAGVGKRGRPPKIDRLRWSAIYADYLERTGTPFRKGRNSKMNRHMLDWLRGFPGERPRGLSPDAVRNLLKDIESLRR